MTRRAVPILLAALILVCPGSPHANPTAPQVVSGQAAFAHPDPQTLQITNSANAIINWGQFSIPVNEITRFLQPSAASAVLNRVVGADPSAIMGQLHSNGHVFLINPNGMVFGPDAVIDTAGFTASTLNISDENFLRGRLEFTGGDAAGEIVNQGFVTAGKNGDILLIAPNIVNSGTLYTEGGNLLLAAGRSIIITSMDVQGLHFEIQAPDDAVVNLGRILAENGAAGIFAGTLRNDGEIRAGGASLDQTGAVVLHAAQDITLGAAGRIIADGSSGGSIHIESDQGTTLNSGLISAVGIEERGGDITLLGDRVGVIDAARVDASGAQGGGTVLIGGDFQGNNSAVKNARRTYVGHEATIAADATQAGDGGRIIVWSDEKTGFYGSLSARGGPLGGDGGFAEISGKLDLDTGGHQVSLAAPQGRGGTLLYDPARIEIVGNNGGETDGSDANGDVGQIGGDGGTLGQVLYEDVGNSAVPFVIYESEIEGTADEADIILEATDSITVSGTFGGNELTVDPLNNLGGAGGYSLTLQTRNNPGDGSGGIDLTGSTSGAGLNLYSQGPGDITIITGGEADIRLCRIATSSGNVEIVAGGDLILGTASTNIYANSDSSRILLKSTNGSVLGNPNTDGGEGGFDVRTIGLLEIEAATGIGKNGGGAFQTRGGSILFHNTSGDVWIANNSGPIVAGSNTNGNVYLDSTSGEDPLQVGTVEAFDGTDYSGIIAGGEVSLRADEIGIYQPIDAGTNRVWIGPMSTYPNPPSMSVGGFETLDVNQDELDLISAGTLTLGTTPFGNTTSYLEVGGNEAISASVALDFWGEAVEFPDSPVTSSQSIRIVTDSLDIGYPVQSTMDGGSVIIRPLHQTVNTYIGNTESSGLKLSPAELQLVTADNLEIGDNTMEGNVSFITPLTSADLSADQLIVFGDEIVISSFIDFSSQSEDIQLIARTGVTLGNAASGTYGVNNGSGVFYAVSGAGLVDTVNSPSVTSGYFQAGTLNIDAASGTVTINAPSSVNDLQVSGGALSASQAMDVGTLELSGGSASTSGSITVSGGADWTGGVLRGNGQAIFNGGLNIDGQAAKTLYIRTLVNNGVLTWSGTGNILTGTGAVIENSNLGLIRILNDADIDLFVVGGGEVGAGSPPTINNAGTLIKSTSAGTSTIEAIFNNSGTVSVEAGTLSFEQGTYIQSSGITQLAGGDLAGELTIDGGLLTGSGTISGNVTVSAGTIAPGASPGLLVIDGDLSLSGESALDIEIQSTAGYDQVQVTGALSGKSGQGAYDDFGTLNIITLPGYSAVEGDTFTIITAGSGGDSGVFSTIAQEASFDFLPVYDSTSIILNLAGIYNTWIHGTDGSWAVPGYWSFGTVPGDGDKVRIIDQTSTVSLTGGTYAIESLSVAGGNALSVTGGSLTLSDASTIDSLSLSGGTLVVPAGVGIGAGELAYTGGSLQLVGTATVDRLFSWNPVNASSISGAGTGVLNLAGTTLFSGAGIKTFNGVAVHNTSDAIYSAGTLVVDGGAVLDNTGLLEIQADLDINAGGGGGGSLVNSGTVQKSGGTGDASLVLPLTNTGLVAVDSGSLTIGDGSSSSGEYAIGSGARLELSGAAVHTITGAEGVVTGAGTLSILAGTTLALENDGSLSVAVSNSGTLTKTGSGGASTFNGAVSNSGSVIAGSGRMVFDGGYSQSAGIAELAGGDFSGVLVLDGGMLTGSGTVFGDVVNNAGTIAPGASTGILKIDGDLSLTGDSTLEIEIGGLSAGIDYDQVQVTGTLSGAGGDFGTLNIIDLAGYSPAEGDGFTLITAGSGGDTGTFATILQPESYGFAAVYDPAAVALSLADLYNIWILGGDGFWGVGGNWSLGRVPDRGENALIKDGTSTVTLDQGSYEIGQISLYAGNGLVIEGGGLSIGDDSQLEGALRFSGGQLTGAGGLTVLGAAQWEAGTHDGSGVTTFAGGLTLDTGADKVLGGTRQVVNAAEADWLAGDIVLGDASRFDNQGTLTATAGGYQINGAGGFANSGTLNVALAGAAETLGIGTGIFDHRGLVDVQSGVLELSATGGTYSGDFDASGALLRFVAGNYDLSSTVSLTGDAVRFDGAAVAFESGATYEVTGATRVSAGAVSFAPGALINNLGSELEISGGSLELSSGTGLSVEGYTQSGGILGGTDGLTVTGAGLWQGGVQGGSGVTTFAGGLTLDTAADKVLGGTRQVVNTAVADWLAGDIVVAEASRFENQGTLTATAGGYEINGAGVFANSGTLNVVLAGAADTLGIGTGIFDHSGLVDVQSGVLELRAAGGTYSGDFDASGALLRFVAGDYDLSSTVSLTGDAVRFDGAAVAFESGATYEVTGATRVSAGAASFAPGALINNLGSELEISGGSLELGSGAALSVEGYTQNGGTLNGTDGLTVTGAGLWQGGVQGGSGVTTFAGGLTLDTAADKVLSGTRQVVNTAVADWSAGDIVVAEASRFENQGTLTASAGGYEINGAGGFANSGTLNVDLAGAADTLGIGTSTFENSGLVDLGTGILETASAFSNAGTLAVAQGAVFSATGSGLVNSADGLIRGTGTIRTPATGLVNQGVISPGDEGPGILVIDGDLELSNAGTLEIEIKGLSAGIDYDQVQVTGTLSGAGGDFGTLNIIDLAGYSPAEGDGFTLITAGSGGDTGTFATILQPESYGFAAVYDPAAVALSLADLYNIWILGGDGFWGVGGNWSLGRVPDRGENALIKDGTSTVTLDQGSYEIGQISLYAGNGLVIEGGGLSIGDDSQLEGALRFSGGQLTGAGGLTVLGAAQWEAGTHDGSGVTTFAGGLTLDTGADKVLGGTRQVVNTAEADWLAGDMVVAEASRFENQGTLTATAGGYEIGGTGVFTNSGTLNVVLAGAADTLGIGTGTFDHSGLVDVQSGVLELSAAGGAYSGDFDASGALLRFVGGDYDLSSTVSLTGDAVRFDGAAVAFESGATYEVTGATRVSAGAASFAPGALINNLGSELEISGGSLELGSGTALSVEGYTQSGGTLNGTDGLTVTGAGLWQGGVQGGSGVTTFAGGLTLDTAADKVLGGTRQVVNTAVADWLAGDMVVADASRFENQGTLTASAGGYQINGAGVFANSGTLNVVLAGAADTLGIGTGTFDHSGLVDVQSGVLELRATGGTYSGDFDASGALLRFVAGDYDLSSTVSLTGDAVRFDGAAVAFESGATYEVTGATRVSAGAVCFAPGALINNLGNELEISGGSLELSNGTGLSVEGYTQSGGILGGTDGLTVTGAGLWQGGVQGGSGVTTFAGGLTLDTAADKVLSGTRQVVNTAVADWSAGDIVVAEASRFENQGTLTASAGGYEINGAGGFANSGTLNVDLAGAADTLGIGTSTFENSGLVDLGTGILETASAFSNAGTLAVAQGAVFSATGSGLVNSADGLIRGTGTIRTPATGLVNQGVISPGDEGPGILVIDGDLELSNAGTLEIEIKGLSAGIDYDQVQVTGTLSGAGGDFGTLNIIDLAGYSPAEGDGFTLITAGSGGDTGAFATANYSNSFDFEIAYAPQAVSLSLIHLYNVWTGAAGSDFWGVAENWRMETVPDNGTNVRIVDGSSTVNLSGGSYEIGILSVAGGNALSISGGSLTISDSSMIDSLSVTGGSLVANADSQIGALNLSSGDIGGLGVLTAGRETTWSGGTLGSGGGRLVVAGGLSILDSGQKALRDYTLENAATVTLSADQIDFHDGATIYNVGVFDIRSDALFTQVSGDLGAFFNAADGTVQKTAGPGAANFDLPFDNSGDLRVAAGTLSLNGGGIQTGGFTAGAGTVLVIGGGVHQFDAGARFDGEGTYRFSGGMASVNDSINVADAEVIGGTLKVPGTLSIGHLSCTGGLLEVGGTVSVGGAFDWNPGDSQSLLTGLGTGVLNLAGTTTLAGTGGKYLDGITVNNTGVLTYLSGGLQIGQSATAKLNNAGMFDIQGDLSVIGGAGGNFANAAGGTVQKTAGSGTADFDLPFDNKGDLRVAVGTLALNGWGMNQTGGFTAEAGTVLVIGGGVHHFDAGARFDGQGTYRFSGGTASVNDSISVADLEVIGGTLKVPGTLSIGDLSYTGGLLEVGGTISVAGAFDWNPGESQSLLAGLGTGVLNLAGTTTLAGTGGKYLDGIAVNNTGVLTCLSGGLQIGQDAAAQLINSGTFDLQGDLSVTGGAGGNFTNTAGGTVQKTAGSGTADFDLPFDNGGDVRVAAGTLALNGGGIQMGGFTAETGTAMVFGGGVHQFEAGTRFDGQGTYRFSGGTASINSGISVADLELTGGSLTLPGTISVGDLRITGGRFEVGGTATVGGLFEWNADSDSTLDGLGTGVLNLETTTVLAGTGTKYLDGITVNNTGIVTYTGGELQIGSGSAAEFNNAGLFDLQGDLSITGGTGGNFTNAAGATVQKTLGTGTAGFDLPFANNGDVRSDVGTLAFSRGYTQSGGVTRLAGGDIAGNLTIDGGRLTGSGTICGNVAMGAGTIVAGSSTGILVIEGDLGLTGDSVLDIEIGGLAPGTGYDQVQVTGILSGEGGDFGTLNLIDLDGYNAAEGDAFTLIAAGSGGDSGAFSTVNYSDSFDFATGYGSQAVSISLVHFYNVWTGAGEGDFWNVAENWRMGTVPDGGTNVRIVDGTSTVTLSSGSYEIGILSVAAGNALSVAGGSLTILDVSTADSLSLAGGTLAVANGVSIGIGDLAYSGGALQLDGTAAVDRTFTWNPEGASAVTGGGSGILNLAGTSSFSGTSTLTLDGITLNNTGDLVFSSGSFVVGGVAGALFNNPGQMEVRGDLDILDGGGGRLVNAGTLQKNAGAADSLVSLPLSNSGAVRIDTGSLTLAGGSNSSGQYVIAPGGLLQLTGAAPHSITAAGGGSGAVSGGGDLGISADAALLLESDVPVSVAVINAGTLTKTGGSGASLFSAAVTQQRQRVVSASGTMAFSAGYTQTGGLTQLAGGDFSGDFTLLGGLLSGEGILSGNLENLGGTVSPGASPGILAVGGDYIQGTDAVLSMEIGGFVPGNGFDHLAVSGAATLDGTLDLTQYGGFISNVGDRFEVMTYNGGLSGDFATITADGGFAYNGLAGVSGYVVVNTLSPIFTALTNGYLISEILNLEQQKQRSLAAANSPFDAAERSDQDIQDEDTFRKTRLICR